MRGASEHRGIAFRPALEQAAAIRRGEIGARELAELYLERIDRFNPLLNAFWITTPEIALANNVLVRTGPLANVCVSIKDLVPLAGHRHTLGSRALSENTASIDGFVVQRLREEGCRILGKTTTPEFGGRPVTDYGLHGACRNPWNQEHTAGGSSGGAASALAAGLCAMSHGSDGGGSVRVPAACCGVVGLKPSRGRISQGPEVGEAWSGLLTDGVLARTVADAAAGLDAMVGHLLGDPYWAETSERFLDAITLPPRRLRVAFTTHAQVTVDPEIVECVRRVANACESFGHKVVEDGPATAELRDPQVTLFAASMGALPVQDLTLLDPVNVRTIEYGRGISAADYLRGLAEVHRLSRQIITFWDNHDILITPTVTRPAPRVGEMGSDPRTAGDEHLDWLSFTYPYNCTGQPAISLPLGMHSSGLPIGVQLVGRPRGDVEVLALGAQLEKMLPWSDQIPEGWD